MKTNPVQSFVMCSLVLASSPANGTGAGSCPADLTGCGEIAPQDLALFFGNWSTGD